MEEQVKNKKSDQYFCGHCKISVASLQDLKDHLGNIHKNDAKDIEKDKSTNNHKCDACIKSFPSRRHLKQKDHQTLKILTKEIQLQKLTTKSQNTLRRKLMLRRL